VSISQTIRRWTLHHRSDKALQELAKMYNPYSQGWINYYRNFYRTQLSPTLKRIDIYVIRWGGACRTGLLRQREFAARIRMGARRQMPHQILVELVLGLSRFLFGDRRTFVFFDTMQTIVADRKRFNREDRAPLWISAAKVFEGE
jgi:hypothetical protein